MFAIIETGGKQFKVRTGDIISVEKLGVSAGTNYAFQNVMAVSGEGGETTFGAPYVPGASVSASVLGDGKGKKVVVYKYKAKKGFHCKKGHRQPFTRVKIESINV
jgi:large subunit ribosomal protein L21